MIKQFGRLRSGLLLIAALWLFVPSTAYGLDSFGVGARPANPRSDTPRSKSIFVYDLAPGATVNDAVIVANNTKEKQTVKVYGVDSQKSSDGAFACAQEADSKQAVGSWITVSQSKITLEPGKQTKVPFTLKVPSNASVGEQNGCIAIQAIDAVSPRDQNGISLSFRSAIRVAITVPGELKSSLLLESVHQKAVNDQLIVSPTFKNTGNVSVDTHITADIASLFGTSVQKVEGTFLVLRETSGTFNFETKRPFWGGFYTLATTASYKPLSGGESKTTSQHRQLFFASPHPLALFIETLIVASIVGAVIWFFLRKKHQAELLAFSRHHTIKVGENVQSIGEDYAVSWKLVARVNGLKPPYTLTPGKKLLIPATHKTRKK